MTVCSMMSPSLAFARATGTRCAHTCTVGGCVGGGVGIRGSVYVGVGVGVCAHTGGTSRTHTHATVDTIIARECVWGCGPRLRGLRLGGGAGIGGQTQKHGRVWTGCLCVCLLLLLVQLLLSKFA
jgi:hypothetical protein